ncbi:unnamed protein product [Ectocarpus sp. 4 AP-2014]
MVMSGASSCSPQSSIGGGGSNIGRSRLSVAAATGARAEGGKPVASSLSGMLGGMRGRQPAASSRDEEGCGVAARGAGVGQTSTEDWMAINLEKLSNFRVPETRMGFPEGGREGLRRSATAPSRSPFLPRPEEQQAETRQAGAAAGRAGEPRWEFGCWHPLGRGQQQQQQRQDAPVSDGTRLSDEAPDNPLSSSPPPPDLPLRTRVRFEMAPGVAVPRGIGSLPGHLESRALRAFAAGSLGMRNRSEDEGVSRQGLGRGGGNGGEGDSEEEQGWSSGVAGGGSVGGRRARLAETLGERGRGRHEAGANDGPEAATPPATAVAAAAAVATASERKEEEAMEKWRKATLYWEHPATPLPQEALAAQKAAQSRVAKSPAHATKAQDSGARPGGSAASGWTSFFWSRRRDWEQAFGSLYYGLISRNRGGGEGARGGRGSAAAAAASAGEGEGEGFYLQCPLYTVVWRLVRERGGAEDEGTQLVPAAVMTRSTRRLRKRLTAAGVEFGMPLDPWGDQRDAQASHADEDVLEEWKAMDATGNAKPGAVYANEEDR